MVFWGTEKANYKKWVMCRLKVNTFIIFLLFVKIFMSFFSKFFYKFFSNTKRLNIANIFQGPNIISENVYLSNQAPKV